MPTGEGTPSLPEMGDTARDWQVCCYVRPRTDARPSPRKSNDSTTGTPARLFPPVLIFNGPPDDGSYSCWRSSNFAIAINPVASCSKSSRVCSWSIPLVSPRYQSRDSSIRSIVFAKYRCMQLRNIRMSKRSTSSYPRKRGFRSTSLSYMRCSKRVSGLRLMPWSVTYGRETWKRYCRFSLRMFSAGTWPQRVSRRLAHPS